MTRTGEVQICMQPRDRSNSVSKTYHLLSTTEKVKRDGEISLMDVRTDGQVFKAIKEKLRVHKRKSSQQHLSLLKSD